MTDAPIKPKAAYVELGSNPHENGANLAMAAEQMLLDLGKTMERTAEVDICEDCFWSMVASIAVIQASHHRDGDAQATLITVARVVKAMITGAPKPTCH